MSRYPAGSLGLPIMVAITSVSILPVQNRGSRHNRYHLLFESEEHLTIILHLALAMLNSLGLHQKPNPTSRKAQQPCEHENVRTTDEQRAYLGCFYATCVYVDRPSYISPQ